jgi:hypothetical protein
MLTEHWGAVPDHKPQNIKRDWGIVYKSEIKDG